MKIGLFFGSFNPVHNGHLIIANYTLEHSELNQIWMVLSPQNPFKQNQQLLNEYQRLYLMQIAVEGEQHIKAVDIEFSLPKPSYTINTLAYLEEKYPNYEFSIIMGSDSAQNIKKWKSGDVIFKRYSIYVYDRPGFELNQMPDNENIIRTKAPLLEISSSMLRKMIKEKKSIRYYVPDSVYQEIIKAGYYK
jgi:nicotinate-nucleotide adenylyltransferase